MNGVLDPRLAWLQQVLADHELSRTARQVATHLVAYAGRYSGELSVGVPQLAALCGVSTATVKRAMAELTRPGGWVTRARRGLRGRHTALYRLENPALFTASDRAIHSRRLGITGEPESANTGSLVSRSSGRLGITGEPESANTGSLVSPFFGEREGEREFSLGTGVSPERDQPADEVERYSLWAILGSLPAGFQPVDDQDRSELRRVVLDRLRAGLDVEHLRLRAAQMPRHWTADASAAAAMANWLDRRDHRQPTTIHAVAGAR